MSVFQGLQQQLTATLKWSTNIQIPENIGAAELLNYAK